MPVPSPAYPEHTSHRAQRLVAGRRRALGESPGILVTSDRRGAWHGLSQSRVVLAYVLKKVYKFLAMRLAFSGCLQRGVEEQPQY